MKYYVSLIYLISTICRSAYASERLIVKYKPTLTQATAIKAGVISTNDVRVQQMSTPMSVGEISKISSITKSDVEEIGRIGTGAHVIELKNEVSDEKLDSIINEIKSDPSIDYVVIDKPTHPDLLVPLLNESQWDMQRISTNITNPNFVGWRGDDFQGAWEYMRESYAESFPGSGIVVAVLDSGYTPHQNFVDSDGEWHLVGYSDSNPISGYTFLSSNYKVNALDDGCSTSTSSWHGTHVTGTVIAQGEDLITESGIKGGSFGADVLPVKVLDGCGNGNTSDWENGMLWASGNSVPNGSAIIPGSSTVANVLNLSLTSLSSCDSSMQDTINIVTSNGTNGVIIVAAAGNAASLSNLAPANCKYVISVAAKGPENNLAYYSNYGSTTITASGGNDPENNEKNESEILSTLWSSSRQFESVGAGGYGTYGYKQGTSMATPHVSAAVADIIQTLQLKNKTWNYSSIVQILQLSADNLSDECNNGEWAGQTGGCVSLKSALNVESAVKTAAKGIPVPQSNLISGVGGAGCSFSGDGDDFSLIILLLLSLIYFGYLKKYVKLHKKD